jgi:hypothetical protein
MRRGEIVVPIPKAMPKNILEMMVLEIKEISKRRATNGAQGNIPIINPKITILNGLFTINFSFKILQILNFGSFPKIIKIDIIMTNIENKFLKYIWKFPKKLLKKLREILTNTVKIIYPAVRERENIIVSKRAELQCFSEEAK